ncbi:hypothetical protein XaC1_539 [Xanthomonas phage XaC1]|nr:hypothetical protein XaC1_539 [Xanthomonas phage XaC1]
MKRIDFVDEVLNNISGLVSHKVPHKHVHTSDMDVKIYTVYFHNHLYYLYYNFKNNTFSISDYNSRKKTMVQSISITFYENTFAVYWENKAHFLPSLSTKAFHINRDITRAELDKIPLSKRHVTHHQFVKLDYIEKEFKRKKRHRNNLLYRIGFHIRSIIRM